jgi:hypothetical protein
MRRLTPDDIEAADRMAERFTRDLDCALILAERAGMCIPTLIATMAERISILSTCAPGPIANVLAAEREHEFDNGPLF